MDAHVAEVFAPFLDNIKQIKTSIPNTNEYIPEVNTLSPEASGSSTNNQ